MKNLFISTAANTDLARIARSGDLQARTEVARVIAALKSFREKLASTFDYWHISGCASGILSSSATLQNGTSLWRLYPTHVYCIGLLEMRDGDLYLLAVCHESEITSVELEFSRLEPNPTPLTHGTNENPQPSQPSSPNP
jgi:hypothetical protein